VVSVHDPLQHVRILACDLPDDEKRRRDIVIAQELENAVDRVLDPVAWIRDVIGNERRRVPVFQVERNDVRDPFALRWRSSKLFIFFRPW
jgi:hypothetical protein